MQPPKRRSEPSSLLRLRSHAGLDRGDRRSRRQGIGKVLPIDRLDGHAVARAQCLGRAVKGDGAIVLPGYSLQFRRAFQKVAEIVTISELPDDLAGAVAELGAPVATFKARGAALVVQMVLAPLLFFLGLAFVVVPIAFLIWGRMGGAAFKSFKLLILGVILLPGAFAMVRRAYRDWGLQVLVFADGLVRAL